MKAFEKYYMFEFREGGPPPANQPQEYIEYFED